MADERTSLRERKRLATMRRVQTVALDLFEEHGFDEVTVERIAEQADVSPSSIYRHFGTKEQLVIWDEFDPAALAAIEEELEQAPPLEALRRVVEAIMRQAVDTDEQRIHRRLRIAFATPAVEAASALQTYEMGGLIAAVLARKLGRDPQDLDVQVAAHAFAGGLLGGLRHWEATGFTTPVEEIFARPLDVIERGVEPL
jgi:AcrR family transcriptional regulator